MFHDSILSCFGVSQIPGAVHKPEPTATSATQTYRIEFPDTCATPITVYPTYTKVIDNYARPIPHVWHNAYLEVTAPARTAVRLTVVVGYISQHERGATITIMDGLLPPLADWPHPLPWLSCKILPANYFDDLVPEQLQYTMNQHPQNILTMAMADIYVH